MFLAKTFDAHHGASVKLAQAIQNHHQAHAFKLLKTGKSGLLVDSVFHLLRVASFMTLFVASHEAKFSKFERECSRIRHRLDQMSPFLGEVKRVGSLTTLAFRMAELKGLLKEKK